MLAMVVAAGGIIDDKVSVEKHLRELATIYYTWYLFTKLVSIF